MKKILLTCFILLSFSHNVFCQSEKGSNEKSGGSNTIYIEGGGSAFFYSVNYEHGFFLKKNQNKINGRVGLEFLPALAKYFIPIGVSIDFGKKNSFFQMNLNRTFDIIIREEDESNLSLGIAYVRRPNSGIYFHASLSFLIFDEEQTFMLGGYNTLFWPGIGIGYSF